MSTRLSVHWKFVQKDPVLQRSSHTIAVSPGDSAQAYIFGGELNPREPRDNDVHIVDLQDSGKPISTLSSSQSTTSPTPRVGTASTCLGRKAYLFSGRGGVAMTAIEENGSLWSFDLSTSSSAWAWKLLSPADPTAPYPEGRSYHALTSNGANTIYLHGGCPAKGRLSDLWAFNISTRSWTELAPAPGSGRGGSSIAFFGDRLYRANGFDGKTEQGGTVDIYEPGPNTWTSISYSPNGKDGPEPRSVGCLIAIELAGRPSLVTAFGEHDPSPLGHQGAGRMLDDIWVFDIQMLKWTKIDADKASSVRPAARGWFGADTLQAKGGSNDSVVIAGGLGEDNQRLSDVWLLEFSE